MSNAPDNKKHNDPLWSRLAILAIGLFVLAFLTAIERPHWFHIKPATGTAVAMSQAGEAG